MRVCLRNANRSFLSRMFAIKPDQIPPLFYYWTAESSLCHIQMLWNSPNCTKKLNQNLTLCPYLHTFDDSTAGNNTETLSPSNLESGSWHEDCCGATWSCRHLRAQTRRICWNGGILSRVKALTMQCLDLPRDCTINIVACDEVPLAMMC